MADEKHGIPFPDVPEIRVWSSGDSAIIHSTALGKERRTTLGDLGLHKRNTDTRTDQDSFGIGNPQGQEQEGYRVLWFEESINGHKGAIGYYFNVSVTPPVRKIVQCLNYTGTGTDVWEDLGNNTSYPTPPAGLKWHVDPVVEISGNNLDVSQGVIRYDAALVTVPANSFSLDAVTAETMRPVTLVADYTTIPAQYKVVQGAPVGVDSSYGFEPVPAGTVWVGYYMVRELGIAPEAIQPVTSITLNGGPPIVPGVGGNVNLEVATFTPIAAGQYNPDHPAINTLDELAAYLLSGGTYTPPTPTTPAAPTNPVTDDTADVFKANVVPGYNNVSDYEIEIL